MVRADSVEKIRQDLTAEGLRRLDDVLLVWLSVRVRVQAKTGGCTAVFSLVGIGLLDRRPFLFKYSPGDALFGQTGQRLGDQDLEFLLDLLASPPAVPARQKPDRPPR